MHETELIVSRSRSKDALTGSTYQHEHRRARGACRLCRRLFEKKLHVARAHTDFEPDGQTGQLRLQKGDMIVLEVSTRILGRRTAPFSHLLIPTRVPRGFTQAPSTDLTSPWCSTELRG